MPETLEGGVAVSFIFSLALVSAAEAEVCFLPTVGANGSCSGSSEGLGEPILNKGCWYGYTASASKPDCGIGKKARQGGMSNGTPCYKCVDETSSDCDRGKLDLDCAEGEARKEVGSTNSGLKCYECVGDVCPSPYANTITEAKAGCNSVTSYPAEVNGTTKPSGEPCYECKTCSKGEHYESKPSDNCHDYTKVDNEPCWTKTFSSYANSGSSCPAGMQLDPCGEGETQTATDTNTCGNKTCYKCEANSDERFAIQFMFYCNDKPCTDTGTGSEIDMIWKQGFNLEYDFSGSGFSDEEGMLVESFNNEHRMPKDLKLYIDEEKDETQWYPAGSGKWFDHIAYFAYKTYFDSEVDKPTDNNWYSAAGDGRSYLIWDPFVQRFVMPAERSSGVNDFSENLILGQQIKDKDSDEVIGEKYYYVDDNCANDKLWKKTESGGYDCDVINEAKLEDVKHKTIVLPLAFYKVENSKEKKRVYYKVKCNKISKQTDEDNENNGDYKTHYGDWNKKTDGPYAGDCIDLKNSYLQVSRSLGSAQVVEEDGVSSPQPYTFQALKRGEIKELAKNEDYLYQKWFDNLDEDEVIIYAEPEKEDYMFKLVIVPKLDGGYAMDDHTGGQFEWGGYMWETCAEGNTTIMDKISHISSNMCDMESLCSDKRDIIYAIGDRFLEGKDLYPFIGFWDNVKDGFRWSVEVNRPVKQLIQFGINTDSIYGLSSDSYKPHNFGEDNGQWGDGKTLLISQFSNKNGLDPYKGHPYGEEGNVCASGTQTCGYSYDNCDRCIQYPKICKQEEETCTEEIKPNAVNDDGYIYLFSSSFKKKCEQE